MPRPESIQQMQAFEAWYANNRMVGQLLDTFGLKRSTFFSWMDRYNWHARADERDTKARAKIEPRKVDETAKLIENQKQAGALLRLKGIEYLTKARAITDGRTAIAAVKAGIELERQAIGLPDYVTQILNAPIDELRNTVADMERQRRASLSDSQGEDSAGGRAGESVAN